jgi:hypothetical protein
VDSPCIYKELLTSLCREHKIVLVLDLHGVAREHEFDIDLGSAWGQSLLGKRRVLDLLLENLTAAGPIRISQNHFPAKGEQCNYQLSVQGIGYPGTTAGSKPQVQGASPKPPGFPSPTCRPCQFYHSVCLV